MQMQAQCAEDISVPACMLPFLEVPQDGEAVYEICEKCILSLLLTQMEAESSSGPVLSRKRRREGSNGETDEGERLGKIPRCTVVGQTPSSSV